MSEKDKEIAKRDADDHHFKPTQDGVENFKDYVEAYNERNREIMENLKKEKENDNES